MRAPRPSIPRAPRPLILAALLCAALPAAAQTEAEAARERAVRAWMAPLAGEGAQDFPLLRYVVFRVPEDRAEAVYDAAAPGAPFDIGRLVDLGGEPVAGGARAVDTVKAPCSLGLGGGRPVDLCRGEDGGLGVLVLSGPHTDEFCCATAGSRRISGRLDRTVVVAEYLERPE
ncbi:MAG TPA: hypothetical protein VEH84_03330 [Alphaproteobacteria bacterium]|nr:hypothetical protein [Alphaproteobacteria bacterium]